MGGLIGSGFNQCCQIRHPVEPDNTASENGRFPIMGGILDLLAPYTETPVWVCVWNGYGDRATATVDHDELLALPQRGYVTYRGELEDLRHEAPWIDGPFEEWCFVDPDLIWPLSHEWMLASDTDLDASYLGGPADLIRDFLDSPALDAAPAHLDDRL
ncbi:MAG: hypothetical protein ACRDP4_05145 [Nocardioidaceae bacterium]